MTDPDARLRLERLLGTDVRECQGLGGQHGVRHWRATLADGRVAFAKISGAGGPSAGSTGAGASAGFPAEARGLRWLAEAGAVPVPEVIGWDEATLVISWLPGQAADRPTCTSSGCS